MLYSKRDSMKNSFPSSGAGQNSLKSLRAEIKVPYDAALVEKGALTAHHYFRMWLGYYFDFCAKYHHEKSNRESVSLFIKKLKEKKQTEEQRKQAFHAVAIFYELKNPDHDKILALKNKKENRSTKKDELKSTDADWRPFCNHSAEAQLSHVQEPDPETTSDVGY